ncbi:MAG TPA: hypothetical protein VHL80_17870 [Polyangia bacterium]|nr:hypothetical protein [Polyangia bacterium]
MAGARAPLVVLLAALAAAAPARADTAAPHARLVYFIDPTAVGCPSAEDFRAAAAARAGHELFGEPSDVTIDVTIRRIEAAYVATVRLPETPGSPAATRELRSETSCVELATAAALVVSIALDPESVLRAPPPPAAPPPPRRASGPWRALVGAGPRGVWGLTPEPTAGLAVSASAVGERFTVGAELGGFLENEIPYARGSVSVLPLTLSVLPCGAAAHLELCAVARLGLVRGTGAGFSPDLSPWKAFGAAGLRAGTFVDVGRLRFRASVEGTGVAPTTRFYVGETAVWATRGVSVAGGLDALLFFE